MIEKIEIELKNGNSLIWDCYLGFSWGNYWEGHTHLLPLIWDYDRHHQWILYAWGFRKKSIDDIPF